MINHSKYVLYFRFLKAATLCFVNDTANPWPSLNGLHEGFQGLPSASTQ